MKKNIIALGFAVSPVFASANLVSNGSFESGVIANNGYQVVGEGDNFITDWNVAGSSVDVVSGPSRWAAADGNQSIDLAGTPGPGIIYQALNTIMGETYRVRFSLSSNDELAGDKSVQFAFGSHLEVLTGAPQNSWTTFVRDLVATSDTTIIAFGSTEAGYCGGLVDDVRVESVPEPSALAALGIGAAFMLRRRRSVRQR